MSKYQYNTGTYYTPHTHTHVEIMNDRSSGLAEKSSILKTLQIKINLNYTQLLQL
jgi:hypothetical protein